MLRIFPKRYKNVCLFHQQNGSKFHRIMFLIIGICFSIFNGNAQTITINVCDSITHEILPGAIIRDSLTGNVTSTDKNGNALIAIKNHALLKISFIGYKTINIPVSVNKDSILHVILKHDLKTIAEVTIQANPHGDDIRTSATRMDTRSINAIPATMGESDIIKSISSTAGIKQVEGNQGFNVRGSSQDQNLILYDDAVIYNCSHLLGMYSVFNTRSIKNATLYKSDIPSRYGGRLASAMVIDGEPGNMQKWERSLSVGLLAGNVSIGGPLIKDTLSVFIAARRSYIDKLILPLIEKYVNSSISEFNTGYFFEDGNIKIQYKPTNKQKIELSAYAGNDKFYMSNPKNKINNDLSWGNRAISLRWRYYFNPTLSVAQSFSYSFYQLGYAMNQHLYFMDLKTGIRNFHVRNEWLKTYQNVSLRFGIEANEIVYNPSDVKAIVNEYGLDFGKKTLLYGTESSLYSEMTFPIGSRLNANAGFRLSSFLHTGPFTKYSETVSARTDDSILYAKGEPVAFFVRPEPRLNFEYTVSSATSLNLAVLFSSQYSHLIPIVASALPIEMWLPSTSGFKPQSALQASIGCSSKMAKHSIHFDCYGKRMYNVSETASTMISFYNKGDMDKLAVQGNGFAYGMECAIEKSTGNFNYSINYTFSRSLRRFDKINNGEMFPAKYDKPHDLTATFSEKLGSKWKLAGLFTYSSGVNITMPISRYFIQNNIINVYGTKNGYRMPAYHRADISFSYIFTDSKTWKSDLTLSVSNVYNRLNPFYMYYSVQGSLREYRLEVSQHKVFLFPVLPSLTFNCMF